MYPESIFIVFWCVRVCVWAVAVAVVLRFAVSVSVFGFAEGVEVCVTVCVDRGVCESIFRGLCFVYFRLGVCVCVRVCVWFLAGGEAAEE